MDDAVQLGTTVSLPNPPSGWFDYRYALLYDGTLALVRADRDLHAEFRRWAEQNYNPPKPDVRTARCRISVFDGVKESPAVELPLRPVTRIDRLADGRWLMASGDPEEEWVARLYASDGAPAGEFRVGAEVEHVRCASDGTIWAGYADFGIFTGDEISASGIAHFSSDGRLLWSFNKQIREDLPGKQNEEERHMLDVCHCYALTLDGNRLWGCNYMEFPIACVEQHKIQFWKNPVRFANAMAVAVRHVVLAEAERDGSGRIVFLRLGKTCARPLAEWRFQPPKNPGLLQGQGAILHIVREGRWTKLDVATLRAAVPVPPGSS